MGKHRITIVVGLFISVALLWWALRDVSISELLVQVGNANFLLLGASVAVATGTFALRALRWRVLLLPALEHSAFRSRFSATCIGFAANNLLPARLGEFARVVALTRLEPIGIGAAFASLVIERLFDAIVLMVFLFPAFYLPGLAGEVPDLVRQAFVVGLIAVGIGLITLGLLVRFPDRFLEVAERWMHRLLPDRFADRIGGLLSSFITGLGALRHAHVFMQAIAWTVVVWLWNAASFWLGFLAFDIEGPGFAGAVLLQSIIGFAVSIPSSPGFFGPFEAASRVGLSLYGVDPTRIISFAAGYHIFSMIPITVIGLYFANQLGLTWSEVERSEEVVESAGEHG
jgi:uncharacterized protein (TIRG00374 family)